MFMVWSTWRFYLALILVMVIASFTDMSFTFIKKMYFPTPKDIVMELNMQKAIYESPTKIEPFK